ncbi:isochorismate synthase [Haemophilus paraphrohaemolyticus]|uniref:Isochorismate synthase MenF n=1 Tax=Haemophilus paraphrohaemolyticus TaxID=736 RepID=A0A369ZR31_9PAST|nr:isochorismate synthase [Haemophilus paraphrohaemolyticus]RDF11224.1 isochorismate synthase [Haemophilus paraphrohaemolyticus]
MSVFTQLKQQLSEQLSQLQLTQEWIQLKADVDLLAEESSLLGWLKSQNQHFPHFFFEKRDENQTIATIGAVETFSSLEEAQAFVQSSSLSLVGGIQFEGLCQFVLPRLILVKNSQKLTAYLTLNISEQAVDFTDFFAEPSRSSLIQNHQILSPQPACTFEQWKANIEQAIIQIKSGDLRKVVLANATQLTFENHISAYDLVEQSREINLGCYHFLWAENAQNAFIGSTPERLYYRKGNQLFTEALAGTVAVSDNPIETEKNAQWLLKDTKNIYENQLVVEDIEAHLNTYVEAFEVHSPEIKRLHNVQHLRRRIEAILKADVLDQDCLRQIHPTAAIAGLPRAKATQFIAKNEPFKRGWYAGTLGIFNPQEAEFCVTLRSAKIEHNQITLYAGAGIVKESEPVSEWQEIERKSQALAKLLS